MYQQKYTQKTGVIVTWSMMWYTVWAAPLAVAKYWMFGAAFPKEKAPIITEKNTCNIPR